jgi:hypothetical protein
MRTLPLQQRASSVTQAAERTDPRVLVAKKVKKPKEPASTHLFDHVADLPFDHLINYPISLVSQR